MSVWKLNICVMRLAAWDDCTAIMYKCLWEYWVLPPKAAQVSVGTPQAHGYALTASDSYPPCPLPKNVVSLANLASYPETTTLTVVSFT